MLTLRLVCVNPRFPLLWERIYDNAQNTHHGKLQYNYSNYPYKVMRRGLCTYVGKYSFWGKKSHRKSPFRCYFRNFTCLWLLYRVILIKCTWTISSHLNIVSSWSVRFRKPLVCSPELSLPTPTPNLPRVHTLAFVQSFFWSFPWFNEF